MRKHGSHFQICSKMSNLLFCLCSLEFPYLATDAHHFMNDDAFEMIVVLRINFEIIFL